MRFYILRPLALVLGILLCGGLAGCLETGLGDPVTAPQDARLEGLWQTPEDANNLFLVKPWGDSHTYALSEVKADTANGTRTLTVGRVHKAWLAKVGQSTFITLDSSASDLDQSSRPFVVARIEFKGDSIVARGLDSDFVKDAKTPAALESLVKANLDNPKLFAKEDGVYKRANK
jgi:hypothetical protein